MPTRLFKVAPTTVLHDQMHNETCFQVGSQLGCTNTPSASDRKPRGKSVSFGFVLVLLSLQVFCFVYRCSIWELLRLMEAGGQGVQSGSLYWEGAGTKCSPVITEITRATGCGRMCPPHQPHGKNIPGIDVFVSPITQTTVQIGCAFLKSQRWMNTGEFISSSVLMVIMTYANRRLSAEMSLFIREKKEACTPKIESV